MAFDNENKITENELCDHLQAIIKEADKNNKILAYKEIVISSTSISGNTVEKYTTPSVTIKYTLNKDVNRGTIKLNSGSTLMTMTNTDTSKSNDSYLTAGSHTIQLSSLPARTSNDTLVLKLWDDEIVVDEETGESIAGESEAKSVSWTIYYRNRIIISVGTDTLASLTDANISGSSANSKLVVDKAETDMTITASTNQYIYVYTPSSWGTPKFYVGGFEGGFSKVDKTLKRTVGSGSIEYVIYKTEQKGLGNTTVTIKY